MRISERLVSLSIVIHVLCFPSSIRGTETSDVKTGDTDSDDLIVELENEDSEIPLQNIFEPTSEWKVIEENQAIPPGLHVRMNLQTGLKEAKILDRNEEADASLSESEDESQFERTASQSAGKEVPKEVGLQEIHEITNESSTSLNVDKRRAGYHGKSDRRGIINKKTKAFTKVEFAEMLKRLNDDDSVDVSKLPGITSSSPVKEAETTQDGGAERRKQAGEPHVTFHDSEHELPLTFHGDVGTMLKHAQTLADEAATVPQLIQALEELEFYAHQIDNAQDLNVMGGLVLVVRLLNHSEPDIRSHAAHVLGSASQRLVYVYMYFSTR